MFETTGVPNGLVCPCGRVAAPAGLLCDQCGNQILKHLRQIEHCALALSAVPTCEGDDSRAAPGFGSVSPARDEVIVETDPRSKADEYGRVAALAALSGWARLVSYERDSGQPERVSVSGECGFLRAHHAWILTRGWVGEYADELGQVCRRLAALVGFAPDPPAGDCMRVGCCGQVYPLPDASGVRCRACHTVYTGIDLARLHVAQHTTVSAGHEPTIP